MQIAATQIEVSARPPGSVDDGVRAISGLLIGLGISALLWLLPLSAWLLLS